MAQLSTRRLAAAGLLLGAASLALPATAGAAGGHGAASKGAAVRTASSSSYGKILVTASGRTLYVLVSGSGTSLPCSGTCASLWPPLFTSGKPHAVKGLSSKLLGTVKVGHKRQVTYDHHPLYLYAGDSGKGQVHGEGIKSFGGSWYVVGASGSPVTASVTSSGSGSSSSSGGGW